MCIFDAVIMQMNSYLSLFKKKNLYKNHIFGRKKICYSVFTPCFSMSYLQQNVDCPKNLAQC